MLKAGGAGTAALGLAACGSANYEPTTSMDSDAPNTLLIFTDSTRADYIGAYNDSDRNDTPNLDALARESLRFSLAVPEAMPTGPARRALLSGMRSFPFRNWRPEPALPQEPGWNGIFDYQPMLTEVMGDAGVETAYCTDNPFLVGPRYAKFRRTLDFARPDYSQASYREFNKPFKRPASRAEIERYMLPAISDTVEARRISEMVGWNSLYRRGERNYAAARVMRAGVELLEDIKEPFFLGVDAFDPHEAFDPPRSYMVRFPDEQSPLMRQGIEPIQPFETPWNWVYQIDLTEADIERVRDLYAAEMTFVDKWIGRLLNELDDRGLMDRTAIVYMSDHGISLGEHRIMGKRASRPFYTIYHVPAMIKHPEGRRAGEVSDYFASTHDVARTLLSFMGIRAPGAMDGEDLSVLFEGKEPPPRPYFTAAYSANVLAGDRDWLLISNNDGDQKRLFNRREDPEEREDVADQNPEVVNRLYTALEDEAGGTLPVFGQEFVVGG